MIKLKNKSLNYSTTGVAGAAGAASGCCSVAASVAFAASIAAAACKGLNQENAANWNLDTELAYSIGIGHDLGHAPFGHAGEGALSEMLPSGMHFMHELNSLRVIDKLANSGEGLNLTFAVRDGITCHNGETLY